MFFGDGARQALVFGKKGEETRQEPPLPRPLQKRRRLFSSLRRNLAKRNLTGKDSHQKNFSSAKDRVRTTKKSFSRVKDRP